MTTEPRTGFRLPWSSDRSVRHSAESKEPAAESAPAEQSAPQEVTMDALELRAIAYPDIEPASEATEAPDMNDATDDATDQLEGPTEDRSEDAAESDAAAVLSSATLGRERLRGATTRRLLASQPRPRLSSPPPRRALPPRRPASGPSSSCST